MQANLMQATHATPALDLAHVPDSKGFRDGFDLPDLDDTLARCAELLEQMDAMLGAIEPLAPEEIAHATKLLRAGDAVVRDIAEH